MLGDSPAVKGPGVASPCWNSRNAWGWQEARGEGQACSSAEHISLGARGKARTGMSLWLVSLACCFDQQLEWVCWSFNSLTWGSRYLISDVPCLNFHIRWWIIHTLYLMNSVCAQEIPYNWFGNQHCVDLRCVWINWWWLSEIGLISSWPSHHPPPHHSRYLEGCAGIIRCQGKQAETGLPGWWGV